MALLYEGGIGKLVIVAGPSGAGKTDFLNNPHKRLSLDTLPSPIKDFPKLAPWHRSIMLLKNAQKEKFNFLCLHVDLTQAIRRMKPIPRNREMLLKAINQEIFTTWDELRTYTSRASSVHVITLFVRRKEHFRRWLFRESARELKGNFSWCKKSVDLCGVGIREPYLVPVPIEFNDFKDC